jgi:hypothetical protein
MQARTFIRNRIKGQMETETNVLGNSHSDHRGFSLRSSLFEGKQKRGQQAVQKLKIMQNPKKNFPIKNKIYVNLHCKPLF